MRVWDRKRQAIWIIGGLVMGTYIAYSDSLDEHGKLGVRFFIFMEALILLIMGTLFYLYSRKTQ
jgi:hypothetical protein